ncbi:hypothetical protein HHK36_009579 [Tetracentron sinense]|uniref:Uncharacterized protein n=1 Tax=Tetracentron sinense TaxID=13715 RepID=A0A834ZJ76_TETSI|nr:hypothetical protein HHK36_009579 [Tetracentron sinense]
MRNEYFCLIKQSSGDSGANVKRLELETEAKIHHLKTEAARISHDVVHMLLKHVTTQQNRKRKVELEEHLVEISNLLTGMQEEMQRLTWAMDKDNGKFAVVGGAENDKEGRAKKKK